MHPCTFSLFLGVLGILLSPTYASPVRSPRGISSSLYDDLVLYTKYSSAAYQIFCPRPLGNTLVESFSLPNAHAFIARDDSRREIVVSFRGSLSIVDALTDINVFLVPFVSPGIAKPFKVHAGFLLAYNAVAKSVLGTVSSQLAMFPGYAVVVTGHSLGGSIAALAATALKTALPDAPLRLFTFGQPRTGDANFAAFVEDTIGADNIFRDGVPSIIARLLGYEHHGTQYWQFVDPTPFNTLGPTTVKKCVGGEDPTCSDSILSTGINPAHVFYFGQVMVLNPLVCV
ncbi:Alpha/Beta hydrolase protein [Mycena rosella]|uniref:Alpha/Beta hydrolase protein n=1 Tax=Mycena rosella TaxID=1033263 RepID=A0AAD7GAX8_MYCRO|nr:Alpha/Beta hydrolase protein [Mycena rosella]